MESKRQSSPGESMDIIDFGGKSQDGVPVHVVDEIDQSPSQLSDVIDR